MHMNAANLTITHTVEVFIQAQNAESGPPLGTVLGNLGMNAVKFCQEFNDFTAQLPPYFNLRVKIFIYEDRSFSFSIARPSTGSLLRLLKTTRTFQETVGHRLIKIEGVCITIENLVQLALFIFPRVPLKQSIPMIYGSARSADIYLIP